MRLLAAVLLMSVSLSAAGSCTFDDIDWQSANVWQQVLANCQRPAEESERWLYTWGHEEKIALLTHHGYGLFHLYNDAQQFAFAGVQARVLGLGEYASYPLFPTYVQRLRSSLGTATVAELYRYSRDVEMLDRLQRIWQRQVTKDGKISAPKDDGTQAAARMGLAALAFNQVYPGFLADLPYTVDELIKTTREQLQQAGDLSMRLTLQGRLLGLQRAKQGGGFESNISYGPAIYLSNSPANYLGHFSSAEHSGITCRLSETDAITDISDQQDRQVLLEHDVLLRNQAGTPAAFPGGYNQLANPQSYRLAVPGKVVKHNAVYADNGLIHYSAAGVCRRIRLGDFKNCEDVTRLLRDGQFIGGRQAGALYRFLTFENEQQQLPVFLGLVRACAVKPADVQQRQQQRLPKLPNSCEALQDDRFLQGYFYRQQKKFFDVLAKESCS